MITAEIIVKGCFFISNISCYEVAKDFSGSFIAVIIAFFSVKYAFKQIATQHENTIEAQKAEAKRNTRIELFKDIGSLLEQSSSIIRDVSCYFLAKIIFKSSMGVGNKP